MKLFKLSTALCLFVLFISCGSESNLMESNFSDGTNLENADEPMGVRFAYQGKNYHFETLKIEFASFDDDNGGTAIGWNFVFEEHFKEYEDAYIQYEFGISKYFEDSENLEFITSLRGKNVGYRLDTYTFHFGVCESELFETIEEGREVGDFVDIIIKELPVRLSNSDITKGEEIVEVRFSGYITNNL